MRSSRRLILPPQDEVVTLEEAKRQLRIAGDGQDDLVRAVLAAAVSQLDPATGGWLGRALRPQTWEISLSEFPCDPIELPLPPLLSIDGFTYIDPEGVEQELTEYRILAEGSFEPAAVAPLYGTSWPASLLDYNAVKITFVCGYEASDPDPLPAPIKQAVHLAMRHLWSLGERSMFESARSIEGVESKQWVVSDASAKLIETATSSLLTPYRRYS